MTWRVSVEMARTPDGQVVVQVRVDDEVAFWVRSTEARALSCLLLDTALKSDVQMIRELAGQNSLN